MLKAEVIYIDNNEEGTPFIDRDWRSGVWRFNFKFTFDIT